MKPESNRLLLQITLCLVVTLCLFGCRDKSKNIPDVSGIEVPLNIIRFDQELFSLDTNNISTALAQMSETYPDFTEVYFGSLLGAYDKRLAPDGPDPYIRGFITDRRILKLMDTCQIVYGDFSEQASAFQEAFKFYKYYFPDRETPSVTTYISEYIIGAFIYGDAKLAVGLDFFLGADYPYEQINPGNPNFSDYLIRSFNKDHLVARTLMPLIEDMVGPESGTKLLDLMVHQGKKRYLLEQLLPRTPDSVIFEHTEAQMQWLVDNELDMWAFFLDEELLYSSRQKDIRKFVEPSPDSPGMPPEAPGNSGTWMGYKIVSAYMDKFPETTLEQLLMLQDAQKVLNDSRYRPKLK
ncbi:MAG: hypothetical protein AAFV80_19490 [Bacteroidota bacterium]